MTSRPKLSLLHAFKAAYYLVAGATAIYWMLSTRYSYHIGMDSNYDLLYYHYYLGWSLFTGHAFKDVSAAQLGSVINPLESAFEYVVLLRLSPRIAAATINLTLALTVPPVYIFANSLLELQSRARRGTVSWIAISAAIVGAATPTVLSQAGGTMGDALWRIPINCGSHSQ